MNQSENKHNINQQQLTQPMILRETSSINNKKYNLSIRTKLDPF